MTDNIRVVKEFSTTHSFTVFPDDLNYVGSLFGGKILAEIDLAAVNTARRLLYGTGADGAVTASFDRVDFKKPAHLGDIIEMDATVVRLGRTSIEIHVSVTKEDKYGAIENICKGNVTFVAVKDGKPHVHNCVLIPENRN